MSDVFVRGRRQGRGRGVTRAASDRIGGAVSPDLFANLLDQWECQQVVLRFTAHFDAGEYDQMEAYFAPDAVWHQALGPIRGRDELRHRMASFPKDLVMRHVLTNTRTTLTGTDVAVVDSYFTVYLAKQADDHATPVATDGPRNIGRYHDRLCRIDGRWMLHERQVRFDLTIPAPGS